MIYIASYSNLYEYTLDGESNTPITPPIELTTTYTTLYYYGLAIDNDGILYVAGSYYNGTSGILIWRYNTNTGQLVGSPYALESGNYAWDIILKNNFAYASIDGYSTPIGIIQMELDLTNPVINPALGAESLIGPTRFLAILNSRFYLIDETIGSPATNRILDFDDLSSTPDIYLGDSLFHYYYC